MILPEKNKAALFSMHDDSQNVSLWNRDVIWLFLLSKVVVITIIAFCFYGYHETHTQNLWNRWYSGTGTLNAFYLSLANWDGQHYLLLADWGYGHWAHSQAFFPLYPVLIRVANAVVGNFYWSAFLLNIIFSYFFVAYFYSYARHFMNRKNANWAAILILSYPTGFYLTVFYSEALFLCLLFGFLYYYELRKSRLSYIFAVLLPLSRGNALFVFIGLIILFVYRVVKRQSTNVKFEIGSLAGFLIGGVLYLSFFWSVAGSPLAGIEAQNTYIFGNRLINLVNPINLLQVMFSEPTGWFAYTSGLVDKLFILLCLFFGWVVFKSNYPIWIILFVALVYPPASMGLGGSFSRFSLAAIPFLALSVYQKPLAPPKLLAVIAAGFLALQAFFIYRFTMNMWVG